MQNSNTFWIIFFIFMLAIATQQTWFLMAKKHRRKKGAKLVMTKEMMERLIGKNYIFTMVMNGGSLRGKVVSINETWIELQTKKDTQFINSDYISAIREMPQK